MPNFSENERFVSFKAQTKQDASNSFTTKVLTIEFADIWLLSKQKTTISCLYILFTREKNICEWTLFWNFEWPKATRNFKGFTSKCSSHSWTGEKRSLTVGKIFFTQKRDNYTNKVLFSLNRWRVASEKGASSWRCQSSQWSFGRWGDSSYKLVSWKFKWFHRT